MYIINLDNVSVIKNNSILLSNININIKKGEFISIIGSNGSGKSTLIKLLYGLDKYEGYISIDGYFLGKNYISKIRRFVSIINGDDNDYIYGSVFDELVIPIQNMNINKKEIENRVNKIVSLFNLKSMLYTSVNNISNSKKQVLMFAQALISNPSILLIDDAMNQMDYEDKKLVFDILNKYKKEKRLTIIMSTHDVEDTIDSDKIFVLDKGKLFLTGSVMSVYKNKDKLSKIGVGVPFAIDLSLRLIKKDKVKYVYKDMRKLVDVLWK